ncbi:MULTISPECIES: hypothetical protein [unclassified Corynebacterium]|uniref:hypothetical protein n=1 Tax=unclassified Corynebacterium TaxID=2624378 RepID=UPI0008A587DB|nr:MULTISPECIES: hypothetical protein [unclassified Corynebacterium]OFM50005.1 hypothetical protein HMPREF2681_07130 [Corynebacterium sp. HMSC064H12]OFQ01941.1 hypothetical protein HMPREF2960_01370 [Corynebacterium sp. HMSC070B05]OFU59719.1 hypothetical protein HMPREF3135_09465 [Corynebacterium sp. HMSC14H10]
MSEAVKRVIESSSVPVRYDPDRLQEFAEEDLLAQLVAGNAVVFDVEAKREFLSWWDDDEEWLNPDWDDLMVERIMKDLHAFASLEPKVVIKIPTPPVWEAH